MDLMQRRRMMLAAEAKPTDNKLWLIENGVINSQLTGGFVASAERSGRSGWSGWTLKAPTISQENGYLSLSISGNPVTGCMKTVSAISRYDIYGKKLYVDAEIDFTRSSPFCVGQYDPATDTGYYWNYGNLYVERSSATVIPRDVYSLDCNVNKDIQFKFQISTRQNSTVKIYNIWIE